MWAGEWEACACECMYTWVHEYLFVNALYLDDMLVCGHMFMCFSVVIADLEKVVM